MNVCCGKMSLLGVAKGTRALLVGALMVASSVRAEIAPERLEACREYVADKWGRVSRIAGRASDLRDALPSLPASAWFRRDREDQEEDIVELLDDAADLLLSDSSKDILRGVRRLDEKIRDVSDDLAEANRESVLNPGRRAKCERRIKDLAERRAALRREQAALKRKVLDELRSWGLDVPEASMEPFFASVTCDAVIDGAVVAAHVVAVVKTLEKLMQGDLGNARRYYGMYVVMLDVQLRCFDRFVRLCDGTWLPRVEALCDKIRRDLAEASGSAAGAAYTPDQREQFARNVRQNELLLRAARAYRACLERQRGDVAEKAGRTRRMREVAVNTYETIGNAVALRGVLRSSMGDFEAVMKLDFPRLAAFADEALVAEFGGITERIAPEAR